MIQLPIEHRFAEILEHHLNVRLQKHVGSQLNENSMKQMYFEIKECVDKIFYNSKMNISSISRDWVTSKYYESIKVSDSTIITGDSDTWKHKVYVSFSKPDIKQIPDSDLRFLGGLFSEMTFCDEIIDEINRRRK